LKQRIDQLEDLLRLANREKEKLESHLDESKKEKALMEESADRRSFELQDCHGKLAEMEIETSKLIQKLKEKQEEISELSLKYS